MKKRKEKKKAPGILSNIGAALLLLAGIALVLYPTIADRINDAVNHQAIGSYEEQLRALDDSVYEDMLKAAQAYNERLFRSDPYIGALTAEERAEYESLLNLDGSGMMGYIEVPKSNIYLAIYHGTGEAALQTGAGHLESSSLPVPGESTNVIIAAHTGLPSARLFTDLDQLKPGDTFTLHILRETLTYQVDRMERVEPEKLKNLRIEEGQELCTLITCTPYGINTERLVVTSHRIETQDGPSREKTSVAGVVTSKWNWWFAFLPALLFAGIVAAVILIRKRKKNKKQRNAESRKEEIQP